MRAIGRSDADASLPALIRRSYAEGSGRVKVGRPAAGFDFARASRQARRETRCALWVVIGTALLLSFALSGISACADTAAICTPAGGSFAEGTCIRSGPQEAEASRLCQERGADRIHVPPAKLPPAR